MDSIHYSFGFSIEKCQLIDSKVSKKCQEK